MFQNINIYLSKSKSRQNALGEIKRILEQRHQFLHEEVKNIVPGAGSIVRGITNVGEVPDLRDGGEAQQSTILHKLIVDIDFPSFPRDASEPSNIKNRSLYGFEASR